MNKLIICNETKLTAPEALVRVAQVLSRGTSDGEQMHYPDRFAFPSGVVVTTKRNKDSHTIKVTKEMEDEVTD